MKKHLSAEWNGTVVIDLLEVISGMTMNELLGSDTQWELSVQQTGWQVWCGQVMAQQQRLVSVHSGMDRDFNSKVCHCCTDTYLKSWMRIIIKVILVWPTSWTPAFGSLFLCVWVCEWVSEWVCVSVCPCQCSNPEKALSQVNLWWMADYETLMYVVCIYAGWSDIL